MTDISPTTQLATGPRRHRPSLMLIFIGLALAAMGQTVLFAVLGPVTREIGLSEVQTGLIISVSALTIVMVSASWGRMSDRYGRKKIFAFSLAGFCVTSLLFAALLQAGLAGLIGGTSALAVLIAARVLYGLTVSGGQPAAGGYIADISTQEERSGAMAMIGGAFGIGSILGPATAFAFGGFGVLVPLYVIAVLGGVVALATLLLMQDPASALGSEDEDAKLSWTDRRICWLLLGVVIIFVALSMVQQTVSFYVQDLGGLSAPEAARRTGFLITVLAVANVVTFAVVASVKPGPHMLLAVGGAMSGIGTALLLYPAGIGGLIAAHFCMGVGFGACVPGVQTKASLAVPANQQGAAAGFVSASMAGGFIVGPVLGAGLYMVTPVWTYLVAALLAVAGCGFALFQGKS